MINFLEIDYLAHGTPKQQRAHTVLTHHAIVQKLFAFDPILVGTVPINIDIDGSDLDLICCWRDKSVFVEAMLDLFSTEKNFEIHETTIGGNDSVVARFTLEDFTLEIFGQSIPTTHQFGYRHMLIEYTILQEKGELFRQEIIALKKVGYKTEPAFAKVLGLEGDPYLSLLQLEA